MLRDLRAELLKAFTVGAPAGLILATGLTGLFTATTLANDFVHSTATGELPPAARMAVADAFGPAVSAAALVVALLGIQLVSPEYQAGAIVSTLLAQPRRHVVLAAKGLVAVGLGAATAVVLGPLSLAGISLFLGDHRTAPIGMARGALSLAVALGFAALLGVCLAFLLRSAVAALCVAFLLLVVTLAAPAAVGPWLPGPVVAAWVDDLSLRALAALLGWAVAATGWAGWALRRRDALP